MKVLLDLGRGLLILGLIFIIAVLLVTPFIVIAEIYSDKAAAYSLLTILISFGAYMLGLDYREYYEKLEKDKKEN